MYSINTVAVRVTNANEIIMLKCELWIVSVSSLGSVCCIFEMLILIHEEVYNS